jgi:ribosomal-protein-alanine N-acetyltransferase
MGLFRVEPENYRAEIGYMILPQFHGKGLMSEAVGVMVRYGFGAMGLHSIEAIIAPENHASARVLEKNGFSREAHIKENLLFNGEFLDTVIYSLINPDDRNSYK